MTQPRTPLSGPAAGDAAGWNSYFAPGGRWERNGGRRQTRAYARAFCRHVTFPCQKTFTLLDFGCALGDGLRVFHRRYPQARLYGIDISSQAIERCREALGQVATFFVGDSEAIPDKYDIIYSSHVIEHFVDYQTVVRTLLAKCRRLCIMVPYAQTAQGELLQPTPDRMHQHAFLPDSFDFLKAEGRAAQITLHLLSCPEAKKPLKAFFRSVKNTVRQWTGQPLSDRNIIYDILARE